MTEEPEEDDEEGKQERASTTSEQVAEVIVSPDLKGISDSKIKPLPSTSPSNVTEIEQGPSSRQSTHPFWRTRSSWQWLLLVIIIVGILVVLLVLLWEARNAPGDTVLKDIIGLVQAISWPIVGVIALLLLYKPISQFLKSLGGQNVQSFKISVFQLAVEASKASSFTPTWNLSGIDLRVAPGYKISNSATPSLFQQFKGNEPLDYALIDIGDGKQWLTSRLFIFAIMLERMRGLRCLVFVETTSDVKQRFLGIASPSEIRWKLAMLNPWLEPALSRASYFMQYSVYMPNFIHQFQVPDFPLTQSQYDDLSQFVQNCKSEFPAFPPIPDFPLTQSQYDNLSQLVQNCKSVVPAFPRYPSQYGIFSVSGALEPTAAETLVRVFLEDPNIHQSVKPSQDDWEEIARRNEDPFWEHAHWIDRAWIHKLDLKAGDTAYLKSSPENSEAKQTQALLWRKGSPFVALVDSEKRFDDLVDRHTLLEKVMENLRKELDDATVAKQ